MNSLIPIINQIRDIIVKTNINEVIDLPQIIVVGGQSTGKSSVLESIVGKDFLPRGSGIVTRRPIILQLHYEDCYEDYAIFPGLGQTIFKDFDEVRKEIISQTEAVCGNDKFISKEPLNLQIFSKNVVDLTLVDLPGLTKVPIGDQPQDIDKIIKNMAIEYIRRPNSVILAIIAGNSDLANADSLKLAREYDPLGDRTIGVITKLDIMDKGTDAIDALQGKIYPLKLGYIGVVCRSQQDIIDGLPISEALKHEREFFQSHVNYGVISDRLGIHFLSKTLNGVLINHIKNCLPTLRSSIQDLMKSKRRELESYGGDFKEDTEAEFSLKALKLIHKFAEYYQDTIDGKNYKECTFEYLGSARINYIFVEIFNIFLNKLDPFDLIDDENVITVIRNAKGLRPSFFVPEGAFEVLVKDQIQRFLPPSLECLQMVYEELRKIVLFVDIPEISRYHRLNTKLLEIFDNVLHKCLDPTDKMIRNLVHIEESFINVNHPDFINSPNLILKLLSEKKLIVEDVTQVPADSNEENENGNGNIQNNKKNASQDSENKEEVKKVPMKKSFFSFLTFRQKPTKVQKEINEDEKKANIEINNDNPSYPKNFYDPPQVKLPSIPVSLRERVASNLTEMQEIEILRHVLLSYFNVIRKNIGDTVPKTIIAFLVNRSKKMLTHELVKEMFKEDKFEPYFIENPLIHEKRIDCKKSLAALNQSLTALNTIKYLDNLEEKKEKDFHSKENKSYKYINNQFEINEEVKKTFYNESNSDNSDSQKEFDFEKKNKKKFTEIEELKEIKEIKKIKEINYKKPKVEYQMFNQPKESGLEDPLAFQSDFNKFKPISKKKNSPLDVDSSNIQKKIKNDSKFNSIIKNESNHFLQEDLNLKDSSINEYFGMQKGSSNIQFDKNKKPINNENAIIFNNSQDSQDSQQENINKKGKDKKDEINKINEINENMKENDKEDSNDENNENNENNENENVKEDAKNNDDSNSFPLLKDNQIQESNEKIISTPTNPINKDIQNN